MKNLKLLLVLISICLHTVISYASLSSPFPSSIEGISIKNSHYVDSSTRIIRGMSPHGKILELRSAGVTDILIFKNQTRTEIDEELKEIETIDPSINVKQIEFLWHAYPSYKRACEQTIMALKFMKEVRFDSNRKLFFHCTVGEDRTGHLAGLYRMLVSHWGKKAAFYGEMCENGYANGNPDKPEYVVQEIRSDLSPLFNYMATLIEDKKISIFDLNTTFCKDDIGDQEINYCRTSSKKTTK